MLSYQSLANFGELRAEDFLKLEIGTHLYLVTPTTFERTEFGIFTYDFLGVEEDLLGVKAPSGPKFYIPLDAIDMSCSLSRVFISAKLAGDYLDLIKDVAAVNFLINFTERRARKRTKR